MQLKTLVGSGDRIVLFTLPFLVAGLIVNIVRPAVFAVRGARVFFKVLSATMLMFGVVVWIWSAAVILTKASNGQLVTTGPFAVIMHPLYTSVGLLVIPSLGLLLRSWLGVVVGGALYAGSRLCAPAEERELARTFGASWDEYCRSVKLPWM
jgi:protein-S-isoprenylcysteine O-methyltransferase Ste14